MWIIWGLLRQDKIQQIHKGTKMEEPELMLVEKCFLGLLLFNYIYDRVSDFVDARKNELLEETT